MGAVPDGVLVVVLSQLSQPGGAANLWGFTERFSPEKNLILSLVWLAWVEARKGRGEVQGLAQYWWLDDDGDEPCRQGWVCQHIGVDRTWVRRIMRAELGTALQTAEQRKVAYCRDQLAQVGGRLRGSAKCTRRS